MVGMKPSLKDVLLAVAFFAGYAALSRLRLQNSLVGYSLEVHRIAFCSIAGVEGLLMGAAIGSLFRCLWRGALIGCLAAAAHAFPLVYAY